MFYSLAISITIAAMKKFCLSFVGLFLIINFCSAQWVEWAQGVYDGGRNNAIGKPTVDIDGNQIYLGSLKACLGCEPQQYIKKYSRSNVLRWTVLWSGGNTNETVFPTAATVDAAGNIIVTGFFTSPTFTVDSTTILNSPLATTNFLVKLGPAGVVKWAVIIETLPIDLACDATGKIYMTGNGITAAYSGLGSQIWANPTYSGNAIATGLTNKIVISDGNKTIRFNPNGVVQWVNLNVGGNDLGIDSVGRVYVLDDTLGLTRLSSTGVLNWNLIALNGTTVVVDKFGNSYVLNQNGITKVNLLGSTRWNYSNQNLKGIDCDNLGNVYCSGDFDNQFQYLIPPFAIDPNTNPFGYLGNTTPFRAKLNGTGTPAQCKIYYSYSNAFDFFNALSPTFCQGNLLQDNGFNGQFYFYQVAIGSSGSFGANNKFRFQISASQNFSNPIGLTNGIIPLTVAPGSYFCRAVSTNPVRYSNTLSIQVGVNPIPVVTASGPTSFCVGDQVELVASYSATGVFDFEWSKDGLFYDLGNSIIVTDPGSYSVIPTNPDQEGCDIKISSSPVVISVPCKEADVIAHENKILASPNPSSDFFKLELNNSMLGKRVEVYNAVGSLIETIWIQNINLSIGSTWEAGVYFLIIKDEENIQSVKLLKN
jgi:hypothetical protein